MAKTFFQFLIGSFLSVTVLLFNVTGGYGMAKRSGGASVETAITVEPFTEKETAVHRARIESVGRELLESLFPHDYASSSQARGKVTFVRKEGGKSFFELNALFLYRETYTAVTHRVLFSMTGDEYSVVSIDGGK